MSKVYITVYIIHSHDPTISIVSRSRRPSFAVLPQIILKFRVPKVMVPKPTKGALQAKATIFQVIFRNLLRVRFWASLLRPMVHYIVQNVRMRQAGVQRFTAVRTKRSMLRFC